MSEEQRQQLVKKMTNVCMVALFVGIGIGFVIAKVWWS